MPLPPPKKKQNLPILQRLVAIYKIWQEYHRQFPKNLRYTLGAKIDHLLIETIEAIFTASCLAREQKLPFIRKSALKLDTLKFFLQVAWENKAFDNKKYIIISERLEEIGRMLGGWQRHTMLNSKVNPAKKDGE
jgi:hypothetical protein